jgi:hypothetical protein
MIDIVNNLIPIEQQLKIKNVTESMAFPWCYNSRIASAPSVDEKNFIIKNLNYQTSYAFSHILYYDAKPTSEFFELFIPVLNAIALYIDRPFTLVRAALRLHTSISDKPVVERPHIDYINDNIKALVYYVHDSDGPTVVYDKKHTDDKDVFLNIQNINKASQGDAIIFDANQYHSSSHPGVTDSRITLNINYF